MISFRNIDISSIFQIYSYITFINSTFLRRKNHLTKYNQKEKRKQLLIIQSQKINQKIAEFIKLSF